MNKISVSTTELRTTDIMGLARFDKEKLSFRKSHAQLLTLRRYESVVKLFNCLYSNAYIMSWCPCDFVRVCVCVCCDFAAEAFPRRLTLSYPVCSLMIIREAHQSMSLHILTRRISCFDGRGHRPFSHSPVNVNRKQGHFGTICFLLALSNARQSLSNYLPSFNHSNVASLIIF